MRVLVVKIMLVLLIMGLGPKAFSHVQLDNPVGGESFTSGEIVTVQWTELVSHNTINWDLYFSSDGGLTWETIILDIDYTILSYAWTVPEINTNQGVVRVIQDNTGMNYEHECLNFTIMIDSAPPAIDDGAQDITIECSTADQSAMIQNWLEDYGGASATSFCGNLSWTNDYTGLSTGCGATGNASVIFTATDDCGNSSTTSAILTVSDNIVPMINSAAQDMTLECDDSDTPQLVSEWLDSQGGASASDACGSVAWTNDFTGLSDGCGDTGSATVVFTATDECGNTSTTNATIMLVDNSPPVVETGAQDMTIECNAVDQQVDIQIWIAAHGGAVVSDNCGNLTWANDFTGLTDECGETGSASVTFTISDECGNTSTTMAVLQVEDTEPPVIAIMPKDISIECDDPDRETVIHEWLNNAAGAITIDHCGSFSWSNDYEEPSEDCMGQTAISVIFTSTDDCGNSAYSVANIQNTVSTGIDELSELSGVKIYPIPSSDKVHVEIDTHGNSQKALFLFDIGGKLIWEDRGISNVWDIRVGDFTSGIYILRVITSDGSITRKIAVE